MEPFYHLKCEHRDDWPRGAPSAAVARSSCTVRVYGKDRRGSTVVVELHNYVPDFYVSFRNREVCGRVLKGLMRRMEAFGEGLRETRDRGNSRTGDTTRLAPSYVKGIETATGLSALIIDKRHQERNVVSSGGTGYGDTSLSFTYRIQVRCFSHVRSAIREIMQVVREAAAGSSGGGCRDVRFYQSSVEPDVRIAETLGLRPCQWTSFNPSACRRTTFPLPYDRLRSANPETCHTYVYDYNDHIDRNESERSGRLVYSETAFGRETYELPPPPVSVMSFDIECLANDVKVFPTPDTCKVIQIATVTATDALDREEYGGGGGGNGGSSRKCLYTLRDCDPLDDGCEVRCFDEERDMLAAFCADLVAQDPDVITGYYIDSFDLPFVFARFEVHGLEPKFGRLGLTSTCVKNEGRGGGGCGDDGQTRKFSSHVQKSHSTTVHGRTVFDACTYMRKEFTMRSYTLNAVAERFLGSRKDDVHYSQIPSLFESGPGGRAVLGRYCLKDARLVMDLLFNRRAFVHTFERCKVFNTPLAYMLDRGQQVRIMSMLLKWCTERAILIDDHTTPEAAQLLAADAYDDSTRKRSADVTGDTGEADTTARGTDGGGKTKNARYDGAVVIEPKTGLYHDPVVCLDYASLYPSIMIAYNLCHSTMVLDTTHGARLVAEGHAVRTPVGHYFLNTESKKGVLPSILETLISSRAAVRARMGGLDKTSVDHGLLDGQQLALKIAANSVYGATGCREGKLFYLQIPSSVTAFGRELITATKRYVETTHADREVVYGDTDSVMVRMTGWTEEGRGRHLWECADAGDEMADAVTRLIDRPPIRLQFETVYMPFLLASKKRYAAGVYKCLDRVRRVARAEGVEAASAVLATTGREVCCKGLEVVRRDNCLFAKKVLQKAIDMIMDMRRPEHVAADLREDLARLIRGDVDAEDLVVSKQWSKRTKNPTPHDRLAQKMAERNPGEAPRLGDRVQYVVVAQDGCGPQKKLCDRAEDPLYAVEHGLTLDYVYYANNQLLNPLANLLGVVMPHRDSEEIRDMLWPEITVADTVVGRPGRKGVAANRPSRNARHDVPPPRNAKITSFMTRPTRESRAGEASSPTPWPEVTVGDTVVGRPDGKGVAAKRPRRNARHDVPPPRNAEITSFMTRLSPRQSRAGEASSPTPVRRDD